VKLAQGCLVGRRDRSDPDNATVGGHGVEC